MRFGLVVLVAVLVGEAAAFAQVAPGVPISTPRRQPPPQKDWQVGVGLAPIYTPVWQGSRDYALSIFPDLRVNYRDAVFFSVPDGLGWNAINTNGWKIGPLLKFRFGRNENTGGSPFLIAGSSTALRGMGDIGIAGEPGAFVQYSFAQNKVRARAEVRQGFAAHEGLVADLQLGWSDRIGTPGTNGLLLYGITARTTFAGADYTNTYFGVNALQAVNAGLPVFRTGSGLVSTGVGTSLTKPLGKRGQSGAITLFAGYDRLGDVVADSSLIEQRGRRDQFSLGLSYGMRFGFGAARAPQ